MSAKNKVRGYVLEKEVVQEFLDAGLEAKRTWGSNGKSLGLAQDVDVVIKVKSGEFDRTFPTPNEYFEDFYIQCKRKKNIPKAWGFSENVDAVVYREDGTTNKYVVLRFNDFIRFIL